MNYRSIDLSHSSSIAGLRNTECTHSTTYRNCRKNYMHPCTLRTTGRTEIMSDWKGSVGHLMLAAFPSMELGYAQHIHVRFDLAAVHGGSKGGVGKVGLPAQLKQSATQFEIKYMSMDEGRCCLVSHITNTIYKQYGILSFIKILHAKGCCLKKSMTDDRPVCTLHSTEHRYEVKKLLTTCI
jgi:hypothetical protein